MKLVSVFTFLLLATLAAGQGELQKCYGVAHHLSQQNPSSTCAYIEDAVRCGIKGLGLTESSATQSQINEAKAASNGFFTNNSCSQTFDDVFNAIKAIPELLELQGCIDTAATKIQENSNKSPCTYVEEAVECGHKVLTRSNKNLELGRPMATRYLTPYGCTATYDSILERLKNAGPTVSPTGWLTAVMVAFIATFTAVF